MKDSLFQKLEALNPQNLKALGVYLEGVGLCISQETTGEDHGAYLKRLKEWPDTQEMDLLEEVLSVPLEDIPKHLGSLPFPEVLSFSDLQGTSPYLASVRRHLWKTLLPLRLEGGF